MKYYNHCSDPRTGKLIKVDRNTLNPLPGLTFVSIAYYINQDGSKYAVVF